MRRVRGGVGGAQGTVQHSFSADLVSESSSAELALVKQQQRTCGAAAGVAAPEPVHHHQQSELGEGQHKCVCAQWWSGTETVPWGVERSERDAWRHCKEPAFGPMGAQNLQQSLNCTLHTPFGEIDVGVVW